MRPPSYLFGIPIDDLVMDETITAIEGLVAEGRRTGRTHQIATVNVDFLVKALHDDSLRRILQGADMCMADGIPVVWASRIMHAPVRERVAGADLVPALVARSETTGLKIHFFGSASDVIERSLAHFRSTAPNAAVTAESGPMIRDVSALDEAMLDEIIAIGPDILCVALGNPKQERFIAAHRDRLGTPVLIGVGGSLDMLVGDKRRAPAWIQRVGLEWVYRAAQEPGRLGKRYFVDAVVFGPRVVAYVMRARRYRHGVDLVLSIDRRDEQPDVVVAATPAASAHDACDWNTAADIIAGGGSLRIDLDASTMLKVPALFALSGLVRVATMRCSSPGVVTVPTRVLEQMRRLGIEVQRLDRGVGRWQTERDKLPRCL
jgi:exopolysaccharide biosynthesis WecB/TagA/CpsF family protein